MLRSLGFDHPRMNVNFYHRSAGRSRRKERGKHPRSLKEGKEGMVSKHVRCSGLKGGIGQRPCSHGDFSRLPLSVFSAAQNSRPPLVLRRPADAQTSSPAGFFRAGCPQNPHGQAKSPHGRCGLRPTPLEERRRSARSALVRVSHLSPSPLWGWAGWRCFPEGRRVNCRNGGPDLPKTSL